jgi:hypothetical protein
MGSRCLPRAGATNIQEFEYENDVTVHHELVFNRLLKQPDEIPNYISGASDSRIRSRAE